MLNLKIIIGSTRPGRAADRAIPWITALSRQHGAFDAEVADLRDWDLAWWGTVLQRARSGGVLPPAIMRLAAAEGHRR
jgi:hypothetical protein